MSKSHSGGTSNGGWFRKGRSGNPRGRPTTSRAVEPSAFDIVAAKKLTVTRHGVAREITAEEALQQKIYQDAVAGKGMAQRQVLKWILKREAWLEKHAPKASLPTITRRVSPDPDNADAALLLLGIAVDDPSRAEFGTNRAQLLLDPGAGGTASQTGWPTPD
jgi:hypothetical protein